MDPISTTAVSAAISGLLKPATDAAGARVLAALKALVRRLPGAQPDAEANLEALEAGGTVDPSSLAAVLVRSAGEDPGFAEELRTWVEEANAVLISDNVSNVNEGTVNGPLVQGRDFSGPMNL
jgi:hypothetical protein